MLDEETKHIKEDEAYRDRRKTPRITPYPRQVYFVLPNGGKYFLYRLIK